jgi:hypothetical protein
MSMNLCEKHRIWHLINFAYNIASIKEKILEEQYKKLNLLGEIDDTYT